MNDRARRPWPLTIALLTTALLISLAAVARAAEPATATSPAKPAVRPIPAGVIAERDLAYAKPDDQEQRLDIFLPQDAQGKLPLVVWIHGGGWTGGDKAGPPVMSFVGQGYVVASLNYRLAPNSIFPAQIEDCKAAIRWLRANADKYHIDPDRIGVWGSSAGGHLVALLGTTGDTKEFDVGDHLKESSRVEAVCDWCGPTDLSKFSEHPAPRKLLGGTVGEKKELAAKASPVTFVGKNDPPFLIMHGDEDKTVPLAQSELLAKALKEAGDDVTFETVVGGGHGFKSEERVLRVRKFFDEHLKTAKKAG